MDGIAGRRGGRGGCHAPARGGSQNVGALRREPVCACRPRRPRARRGRRHDGTSGGRVHARHDPDPAVGQLELGPDRIREHDAAERPDDLGVERGPLALGITFTPAFGGAASLYGRALVIASYTSATAATRANMWMSSPSTPRG